MNTKFSKILVYALFVIVVLFAAGCGGANQATPTPEAPVKSIDATTAEAKVIPVRSADLSFASSGKVEAILADEGSTVKAGDVIARLEGGERIRANIAAAELQVATAQKNLDDLNEKSIVAAADAELALANAKIELTNAQEDRDDLNYTRVNQYTLEGIEAQLILAQQAVEDAEEVFKFVEDRAEDDPNRASALAYLSQVRKQRDQVQRSLAYANSAPKPEDIAKADARLSQAQALVDNAQLEYDRKKAGPDPKDLALAEASLNNAKAQLEAAKASLGDLEITAPFDGVVVSNSLEIGEVSGSATITIGDISSWQVETTDLKEIDVVGLQPGEQVTVRFDAIPGLELPGTVNRIKAFGINLRGDNTYTVYVDLIEQDPRLLWNMTAYVNFNRADQ